MKTYYKRKLPHITPLDGTFFVTFNLKDSIPKEKLNELREMYRVRLNEIDDESAEKETLEYNEWKRYFGNVDKLLDRRSSGNYYLKKPKAAEVVFEQILKFDGEFYDLLALCVMSNHVHLLIDCEKYQKLRLDKIMKRIKGPTAIELNRQLGLKGQFWEKESYDHLVRGLEESQRIEKYILENPVKAGIVNNWENYPFSYSSNLTPK